MVSGRTSESPLVTDGGLPRHECLEEKNRRLLGWVRKMREGGRENMMRIPLMITVWEGLLSR